MRHRNLHFSPAPSLGLHAPRTHRRTPRLVVLLGLAMVCLGSTRADAGCADCRAPTRAELEQQPGFEIKTRFGYPLGMTPDVVETDGGECRLEQVGEPEEVVLSEEWRLHATGAVQNCPSGQTEATVTMSFSEVNTQGWSASVGIKVGFEYLIGKLELEAKAAISGSTSAGRSTSVSTTIKAPWCYIVPFKGFFLVSKRLVTIKYRIKRRYAWWTKNVATGNEVHAKGSIWIDCGEATVSATHNIPLSSRFDLSSAMCPDEACKKVITPSGSPLPPPVPTPAPTTGGSQPDAPKDPKETGEDPDDSEEDPDDAEEGDDDPARDPELPDDDDDDDERHDLPSGIPGVTAPGPSTNDAPASSDGTANPPPAGTGIEPDAPAPPQDPPVVESE